MKRLDDESIEVELLINNAGLGPAGAFVDETLESAMGSIQVNISTLTELTYLMLQPMKSRGAGHVILVGSLNAYMSVPLFAVYSATKSVGPTASRLRLFILAAHKPSLWMSQR